MKRIPIKLRKPIIFDKQNSCPYSKPFGYIYIITNKITGNMYIGKHKYNKPKLDTSYHGGGRLLLNAYKCYGRENFHTEILQWIETNNDDLNKAEMFWIDVFDVFKFPQHYNITPGGDGMTSEMMSGKNNTMYGRRGKLNPNSKPVVQLNLQGEFVSESPCTRFMEPEISSSSVGGCCNHIYKSYKGYRYMWKSEYESQTPEYWIEYWKQSALETRKNRENGHKRAAKKISGKLNPRAKQIVQVNDNNKVIRFYQYMKLTENYGFDASQVVDVCKGKQIHHRGYKFMYLSDYEEKFGPLRTPITLS